MLAPLSGHKYSTLTFFLKRAKMNALKWRIFFLLKSCSIQKEKGIWVSFYRGNDMVLGKQHPKT
jgi:hypothetical protein